jgi:hypothetical protein
MTRHRNAKALAVRRSKNPRDLPRRAALRPFSVPSFNGEVVRGLPLPFAFHGIPPVNYTYASRCCATSSYNESNILQVHAHYHYN